MVSGKRLKYQWKRILDLSFLFTIKIVISGYTLCLLYVCFKIVTRKRAVFSINWNIEKNTTLNTQGLKRGIQRINMKMTWIFHFT